MKKHNTLGFDKIYVINLERRLDRKTKLIKENPNLDFTFIDAIDGKNLTQSELLDKKLIKELVDNLDEFNLSELEYQILHQHHIITNINDELLPIVNEQVNLIRRSYLEGEASYLSYVNGLKESMPDQL